jgi:type VI secretion system protein ImpA
MSTPILDFAALTAPIEGEQPAGMRLPAEARKKMEDARKEFEPNPDDPAGAPIPKKPDWAAIIRVATDSLTTNSKDLLAAARLVEALTKHDGFAGLRDGLILLRMLLTDCWDRVHPLVEGPEDLEYRAGPLQWLCDTESGAWFPTTIAKLPILIVGGKEACLEECRAGKVDGEPVSAEAFQAAEPATAEIAGEVGECLQELSTLDQVVGEKLADQAPSLGTIREVLNDCNRYLSMLRASATEEESAAEEPGGGGTVSAGGLSKPSGAMTRADLYRQLAKLAEDLGRMEPHSPIPDLIRWAVKLGAMPFRELLQEMVREQGTLEEIRRQFGIKEEPPPG